MTPSRISNFLIVPVLCLVASLPALAQDAPAPESPRAAIVGFLEAARAGDYERAARDLDLRRVPAEQRARRGPALARELRVVLDQTLWIDPDTVSDAPAGRLDDDLPPGRDRLGAITTARGAVPVLLERVTEGDTSVWKFSAATVAQIPALYDEFGYGPLGEILPAPLFEIRLLEMALWQWIGLLLLVVVATALSWLVATAVVRLSRPAIRRFGPPLDQQIVRVLIGPLRFAVGLAIFSIGMLLLALSVPVRGFFIGLEKAAAVAIVAWFVVRIVDLLAALAVEHLAVRGQTAAVAVVPLGRKTVKVVIVGLAVLAMLQNLGFNVTGVLAGLGIGGLAVALAAQKTVENLFGGVTLITDQPVRVGDFCRFSDKIGTVEEVGLRSTRVRTLDRTVVSIPNGEFASMQLENFTRRDRIWLRPKIGLRYETTPDQLRYVLVEVRKLLYAHPKVHPEPARIRFVGFGAYSLDLEIFAYVLTQDYGEFLAIQEDIMLRIMDIVAASGTGFAFPSSTTYLGRDSGLDAAKSRAAEEAVRQWRARGELPMPEFPPEAIAALKETISYPPEGAALRPRS